MDERQHLSMRRLSQHPRSDQGGENEGERMNPFTYSRTNDAEQAVAEISAKPHGKFLGGGTNLIDLMKMGVETPTQLVDINRLPLAQIEELPDKRVRIGALARNSDVA